MKAKEIRRIHTGRYLSYYEIDYKDKCGNSITYEMVSKTGSRFKGEDKLLELGQIGKEVMAVSLLVFNPDHTKMLICKEYRMGVQEYVYGSVAGFIDDGESVEQAAARELKEETGLTLTKIIDILNPTYTCAPVTDDLTNLVICEADGEILGSDNPREEIISNWYTKSELNKLLNNKKVRFASRIQAFAYCWVNDKNDGKTTPDNLTELNRCPFCGSSKIAPDSKTGKSHYVNGDKVETAVVTWRCKACHSRGPTVTATYKYDSFDDRKNALNEAEKQAKLKWNTRK